MSVNTDKLDTLGYTHSCLDWEVSALVSRPSRMILAENLTRLCLQKGTAKALSAYLECSTAAVSRWMRGLQEPSFEQRDKIADYLDTSVAALYADRTTTISKDMDLSEAYRIIGEAIKSR